MKQIIKSIVFSGFILLSINANAGQWDLIHSEYSPGNGWICTYQLSGTSYTRTILQQTSCRMFIYN